MAASHKFRPPVAEGHGTTIDFKPRFCQDIAAFSRVRKTYLERQKNERSIGLGDQGAWRP
jgi:hypothetical protein